MPYKHSFSRYLLFAVALFTFFEGCWIFMHPPAIFPDAGWGFQVMRGMQMGGGFNMLPSPDTVDIAKNAPSFLSWWSPGQYLAPFLFIKLFHLNTGQAIAIIATLCSLLGLGGLYLFFKRIGFNSTITALSIAFIASQQAYVIPYVFYNGGEILLFAFSGWFLYGCSYFKRANWLMAAFVLLSGVVGFFCKSSFLWIYAAGCLYLWISISRSKKIAAWIINGLSIGVPAIISLATIYIGYLSKGSNPTAGLGIKLMWETFSFPIAAPLLTGFSLDELTNGLIFHINPAMFSYQWSIVILLIFAVLSIILVISIIKWVPLGDYKLLLIIFYVLCVLFFGANFLRQADISYEARHMRIIGLIITPGIIYLVSKFKTLYQFFFGLLWIVIISGTIKYLFIGNHRNAYETAKGDTGIAQLFIDQPTLNYIKKLDNRLHNALFVFISPDIGLEIKHNRIITLDPANDAFEMEDSDIYNGHAGPVYIILPLRYMGTRAELYLNSFPDYHHFEIYKPGKYLIYSAQ